MKLHLRENMLLEFRRGNLIIAVLAALQHERYGFELLNIMASHGLEIEEFTLYPLLRRLERQGLLKSEWRIEDNRPKRFYHLSNKGQEILAEMLPKWRGINKSVEAIYQEGSNAKA